MNEIKSLNRVSAFGEVYTNVSEVKKMVDLVGDEAERIDSKFLEPACGNGNFLIEILTRRFNLLSARYKKNQFDFDRYLLIAVSSMYGIDILEDNVEECRNRLKSFCNDQYKKIYKSIDDNYMMSLDFILKKNILCGDAISLKDNNNKPIIFTEWSFIGDFKVKRREYKFDDLLAYQPSKTSDLFSDLNEDAFIPPCLKEYQPVHYLKIYE